MVYFSVNVMICQVLTILTACLVFLADNTSALYMSRFTRIQGQKLMNQILDVSTTFSVAQCCISCIRHPDCRAVNYLAATGQCEHSSETHVRFVSEVALDEAWTIYLMPGPCDVTWVYYGTSCYWLELNITRNMTESAKFCSNLGARLLEIEGLEETQFLTTVAKKAGLWRFWLGLNDIAEEQTYVWLSGSPLDYINFGPTEGDRPREDCVNITPGKVTWGDTYCWLDLHIICESPLV